MTLTAPGSISNSGSKPFSNLYGRIALNNYNIIIGSQSSYDFNAKNTKSTKTTKYTYNKYKPKSIEEVLKSCLLN
jgi:hypothetical protein